MLHTDATQAAGRTEINCKKSGIDLLSLSGHKIYGPKGIGVLYVRRRARGIKLEPLQHGGGHQNKIRSGTLPVALIVGLGEACRIAKEELNDDEKHSKKLASQVKEQLLTRVGAVRFNGHADQRISNNLHVTIPNINAEALLNNLKNLVALSTGAACTTAAPEPSHVLLAMGLSESDIGSSIRIGTGRFTSVEEVNFACEQLVAAVDSLRTLGN